MLYYHIDTKTLTIISGIHEIQSTYIKKLTSCGNPECLPNLAEYGIVPRIQPPLGVNQRYTDKEIVFADRVEVGVEDIPLEDLKMQALAAARNNYIATVVASDERFIVLSKKEKAGILSPEQQLELTELLASYKNATLKWNEAETAITACTNQTELDVVKLGY